jgi:Ca2+-binding RTX toxin-like protein
VAAADTVGDDTLFNVEQVQFIDRLVALDDPVLLQPAQHVWTEGDDILVGNDQGYELSGGSGNDVLTGNGGDDGLYGAGPGSTSAAAAAEPEYGGRGVVRSGAWQHEPFWWQPLRGKTLTLRRRGPQDATLVRRAWADAEFMRQFNRMAAELPKQDNALQALLLREHWALPEESRGLHWTIESNGQGCGFVSVVDISLQHGRGEFLIGVLPHQAD